MDTHGLCGVADRGLDERYNMTKRITKYEYRILADAMEAYTIQQIHLHAKYGVSNSQNTYIEHLVELLQTVWEKSDNDDVDMLKSVEWHLQNAQKTVKERTQ
jgi:hypothetical protein